MSWTINKLRLISIAQVSLVAIIAMASTNSAYAIDPNSTQAINIESDEALLDDAKGISSYSGSVIVSQGLSKLEAERLMVTAEDRRIAKIEAWGTPAHFVQQESAATPATHGYAETITFEAAESLLIFTGKARLLQSENSFSGDRIEYDIIKKAIRAQGNESQGSRVKIQYHPAPPADAVKPGDASPAENDAPAAGKQATESP